MTAWQEFLNLPSGKLSKLADVQRRALQRDAASRVREIAPQAQQ
jgi:hypothetical protein